MNNALTRFIFSYRRKASKYVAVVLGLFVGFGFIGTANAVQTGPVQVTCTNGTFGTGWDNANQYFEGKGNIAALYCQLIHNTGYVSDNLSDPSLRYYQGVLPIVDSPTATVETHTAQVPPSEETSTVPSLPQETETQLSVPETGTVLPVPDSESTTSDSQTVETPSSPLIQDTSSVVSPPQDLVLETVTVVDTQTSESSTQTIPQETTTPIETPLPTPIPVVEPQPEPEPLPEQIDEEAPLEEPTLEEQPVVEEQPPVEEPSEHPVEEDTNESPIEEPEILEPLEPTPEPSPQPVVEPEPVIQPDVAPVTPIVSEPMVTLDNGVVLTEEEAVAIVLLQNPTELLAELFTDPGAVLTALGSVGADMTPEVREQSEKVVVSAIIAGGIATQSAATAAGAAAYRRKP